MASSDIKKFIDYFHDAVQKVRHEKAVFVRGKDGALVTRALVIFSRPQLEMLALWFLAHKPKLSSTIGAMLSKAVLKELERTIQKPSFWKDLDALSEQYYAKSTERARGTEPDQMFSGADLIALRNKLFKQ